MTTELMNDVRSDKVDLPKKLSKSLASAPVRIGRAAKQKLDVLIKQANKGKIGRRVKATDILEYALGLIRDEHLQEICNQTLSNKDRMELLYRQAVKANRNLTRDEFLGMVLAGQNFLDNQ